MYRNEKKALSKIKRSLYPISPEDIITACEAASSTETLDKRQYHIVKKALSVFELMNFHRSKTAYKNFIVIYGEHNPSKSLYHPKEYKSNGEYNLYLKIPTRNLLNLVIDKIY